MATEKEYCEVCGAELTPQTRSKSYRHKCKTCVAKAQKEKRNQAALQWGEPIVPPVNSIKIELCGGRLPEQKHVGDACFDLYVPEDTELADGRQIIKLGFKMQLPHGFCAQIRSRSGYASKGLELANSPERHDADVETGIVDENYRGEVGVILHNHKWRVKGSDGTFVRPVLAKGTRIAQMQIVSVPQMSLEVVDKVDQNDARGENGFGSSNK